MRKRLYLDTGDLNRIADGREDAAMVEALRTAMHEGGVALVISRAHMQDALSLTDAATKERFVAMVETFQPVLMVVDGPTEVEPLDADRRDIVVQPCVNFREIVFSEAARPWLEKASTTQDEMHSGDVIAQTIRQVVPRTDRRVSKAAGALFVQAAVTLLRGWMGDDVEAVVSHWEKAGPFVVKAEERTVVLVNLVAFRAFLAPLRETIARDDLDMTDLLRRLGAMGAAPAAYPGQSLTVAVGSAKQRDADRRRQRSDWVDLDHVAHFPYVDLATCDAGTFPLVTSALRNIESPRNVVVMRNGQLGQVAGALRRLP